MRFEEQSEYLHKQKIRMQHFNVNDGLIHNADGTREFLEGGVVGGVNSHRWYLDNDDYKMMMIWIG